MLLEKRPVERYLRHYTGDICGVEWIKSLSNRNQQHVREYVDSRLGEMPAFTEKRISCATEV